jgi:hypothetical protein
MIIDHSNNHLKLERKKIKYDDKNFLYQIDYYFYFIIIDESKRFK